jgi:hypothetical protein
MPAGVVGDVFDTLIVSPFYGTGAAVLVRRHILDQYQLHYDESIVWCQDWDFYVRLAEIATFGFVDLVTVRYRLHETGMTVEMPEGRRLDSLIRMKLKVLDCPRFNSVSTPKKSSFFYNLLVEDLQDRVKDQTSILESRQFRALPSQQQARLLRIAATGYLLEGKHPEAVKLWLRTAWTLAPFDLKTGVIRALSALNSDLAKLVIRSWQSNRQRETRMSPFELALGSEHHTS